jgi:hypothetical protein
MHDLGSLRRTTEDYELTIATITGVKEGAPAPHDWLPICSLGLGPKRAQAVEAQARARRRCSCRHLRRHLRRHLCC